MPPDLEITIRGSSKVHSTRCYLALYHITHTIFISLQNPNGTTHTDMNYLALCIYDAVKHDIMSVSHTKSQVLEFGINMPI